MAEGIQIRYSSPGPVASAFLDDLSFVSAIMGPVGSGKTTTALMKAINAARMQRPSPVDGIKRHRHLIVRDTFVNIKRTVLASWWSWFPKSAGEWEAGPPTSHKIMFDPGDGILELIVDFVGIGENNIEDLLRGYEGTSFYLNEADRLSYDVLNFVMSRMGRYPSARHGGPAWYGGWMDFNAPDTDHWLYELLVEGKIPGSGGKAATGFSFHRQPGGRSPDVENISRLPKGYYDNIAASQPDWMVRRMVDNRWGYSREGKPVYEDFNDDLHVAPQSLDPVKGLPVLIGMDAGMTPAAIFGQRLATGQWQIQHELVPGHMGPTRFAELVNQMLAEFYPDFEVRAWADPSSAFGGDDGKEGVDMAWLDTVCTVMKLKVHPAPSNSINMRLEAVVQPLRQMVEGRPMFQLSPACKILRKGFNSDYRFKRQRGMGSAAYEPSPDKTPASHPHDGLQYLMLGASGMASVMGREARQGAGRAIEVRSEYSMFGD